jgi:signal peptidase I
METLLDQSSPVPREKQPVFKSRNPWIAFLLSLLMPGLGQLYNGQWKKAIIFFVLFLIIPFVFGWLHLTATFWGFIALFGSAVFLRLYVIIAAVRTAKREIHYEMQRYNLAQVYLIAIIAYHLIGCLYDVREAAGVNSFYIPMEAGSPTINPGDYIVSDIHAYKINGPQYGDIITFYGADGQVYVYRVIGLPDDEIGLQNNTAVINGKKCPSKVEERRVRDVITPFPGQVTQELSETLPNGHRHRIYRNDPGWPGELKSMKPVHVPAGHYFVLGDNRSNALDSRFVGFISREQIHGKVVFCLWGKDPSRMGIDFPER